ncbi:hypothetical protein COV06_03160 [Candidatus Uhrbacteria bacterium CG10_big_fil_rev_8_21_14_0_10_50_16]|uniref:Uncharacterized protein n=1 Tax=Candidatus Uhrbacteria bacterium CG10_big_fil_rev_8_21_14_0_10_50_16 TaxID=1975039 RepID=A0A2H0RLL2_9BACT|nr:MAG: hypothetical protein COV06_03160 [Candidatus Uhrbacteria bacterium CG10_big_fil_rev_8_21_14_0_10_50_16]
MSYKRTVSVFLGMVVLTGVIVFVGALYWKSAYIPSKPLEIDYSAYVSETSEGVYRSEAYRFGFQVPTGWTVQESGKRVSVIPSSIVSGRAFYIEVTQLSSEEYKAAREATSESVRVFDEQTDVAGFDHTEKFKISTEIGTDDTILFMTLPDHNLVFNYHEFNEAHQAILQSFQLFQ